MPEDYLKKKTLLHWGDNCESERFGSGAFSCNSSYQSRQFSRKFFIDYSEGKKNSF